MKLYKICTQCSYFCRKEEKDEFCSICGANLTSECKRCGEVIDNPYAKYCKKCGKKYRIIENNNESYKF